MKINTSLFRILLLGIILMPLTLSLVNVKANDTTHSINGTLEIKPMETVVLEYYHYTPKHGYASKEVDWEFESNKTIIYITVWAMDEDDYVDYRNSNAFTFYILSNAISYKDSGTWEVNHEDTWYILFFNKDADSQTITLTYAVEFINLDFFEENYMFFIVVGVIVFVAICAGVSKSQQQAKARQQQKISTPQNPYKVQSAPEPQKSKVFSELESKPAAPATPRPKPVEKKPIGTKFCNVCGDKIDADAVFCHACGSKLIE